MEIFKAQITMLRKLPEPTSVHDRYFARAEDAFQTFKNILSQERGVSITEADKGVFGVRVASKNGEKIAEIRVLKLPVYDSPRLNLDY